MRAPIVRGRTPEQRFFAKVTKTPICWLWTAAHNRHGHGVFGVDGSTTSAHRWSYVHHGGVIPPGYEVDHLCRLPACVNPDHLEAVTPEENRLRVRRARRIILGRRASIDLSWPGFVGEFAPDRQERAA